MIYPGLPWFRDFNHQFLRMRSHHYMLLNQLLDFYQYKIKL